MKQCLMFICALGCIMFVSCDKDEDSSPPNYIGIFEANTIRDECSDPSLNGSVGRDQFGVCLFIAEGQNCIDITLTLNENNTYQFTSQITEIRGGITNSMSPSTDNGSYEVNGRTLTLDPQSTNPTVMEISGDGNTIDWLVSSLSNGCDRFYGLMKN